MVYQGDAFSIKVLSDGIAQLEFNLNNESVNKFNQLALQDLTKSLDILEKDTTIKGLLLTSGKKSFIVGADIKEFVAQFNENDNELTKRVQQVQNLFNRIENLQIPTVSAINGIALGGGFEICLATDYRIASNEALLGLPEVKLGIIPGWGGTVRLPRIIGVDNAVEWICTGKTWNANEVLKIGAIDAVVDPKELIPSALHLLKQIIDGSFNIEKRRLEKTQPIKLNQIESLMAFESAKGLISLRATPHVPALLCAVNTIQQHAFLSQDEALSIEAKQFIKMAKTSASQALISLFLSDQYLKKQAIKWQNKAKPIKQAAVVGAGIMGGGIAYQSALKNIPILLKDIDNNGINLGLKQANQLLVKRVKKGKLNQLSMAEVLNRIKPTLSYGDFKQTDIVLEAVVENIDTKKAVLKEIEQQAGSETIIASNTSSLSISEMATCLKKPEKFCGMHFFNPVHQMPLVEVVRGEQTNNETISTVVNYAKTMGKTPIVVNDCPGFMVNRVLFPYFFAFNLLVHDGADFQEIDKAMEAFGMPMGPAYLIDVIGIDTCYHAQSIMANAYPDRMKQVNKTALTILFENNRLGQKNHNGFYRYSTDKKNKLKKMKDEQVDILLSDFIPTTNEFSDEEIVNRMMIPLGLETIRTLEEGIVNSPMEANMALVLGIGFPAFRGGILKYIETMGLDNFLQLVDQHAYLGPLYQATERFRNLVKEGHSFNKLTNDK